MNVKIYSSSYDRETFQVTEIIGELTAAEPLQFSELFTAQREKPARALAGLQKISGRRFLCCVWRFRWD